MAKARACRYTAPYSSREIHRDGVPFISITREGVNSPRAPRPTDVDAAAKRILKLLCGRR